MAILIVLLGLGGEYFYYAQLTEPYAPAPAPAAGKEAFDALKNLTVDFSVLTNKHFRTLKIYGEFPLNPGFTGKADLFAP